MKFNLCPHCGRPCLSFWSKVSLGPAKKAACVACGQPVGVNWPVALLHLLLSGVLAITGGLLAVSLAGPLPPSVFALCLLLGMVIGGGLELWLYYRFVPLAARAA